MAKILPFRTVNANELCSLCHQPFKEHFNPPPNADWNIAAHWCPNPLGGFTSTDFRKDSHAKITH